MTPITVETIVKKPVAEVWQSWTKPEHIVNWNQASSDWHCPKASNDLKVGGKFSATMEAKDGSSSFDFEGTYTLVEDLKRIEYVMVDGRKVQVVFESLGKTATKVTETFDPETENTPELQRSGWQAIMDNFKNYTESL